MRLPLRHVPLLTALLVAFAWSVVLNTSRIGHVRAVTAAEDEAAAIDPKSPTGLAGGVRQLIVADQNSASYQWIAQAQQGIVRDEWRVRHIDYDNAPFGREVLTPSPYRWWLACVARIDHLINGAPLPLCVETVAPYSDPILQAVLLIISAIALARFFDRFTATIVTIVLAFSFPLPAWFLGGAPSDHGLALIIASWGVIPLLIGLQAATTGDPSGGAAEPRVRRSFLVAGLIGGLALWLNAPLELVFVLGISVGALIAAFARRRAFSSQRAGDNRETTPAGMSDITAHASHALPWGLWALGGAATTLVAYLVEYFPDHMAGWKLEFVHPLYGIAWIALGVVLTSLSTLIERGRVPRAWRRLAAGIIAVAVMATVYVVAHRNGSTTAMTATLALEPSHLPGAGGSDTLWSWFPRAGWLRVSAMLLFPVALLSCTGWVLLRQSTQPRTAAVAFAAGPAVALFVLSCLSLHWWSACGAALVALIAALSGVVAITPRARWLWTGATVLALVPGAWLLGGASGLGASAEFSESDVIALVERDFSHWLANRAGPNGAIVLAPPSLTTSLYYHGGLRGLGTPYWENNEGLNAAIRLAAASSPDEGLALARRRNLNYVVLPSWDHALDELVRTSSSQPEKSILGLLHQWHAPRWLRPVPYPMPAISGFEGQSVAVFEVVDVQDNAVALSRLAEYFVETQKLNEAAAVAVTLERAFPNDIDGMIARAAVAFAYGDTDRIAAAMQVLTQAQSAEAIAALPWDRRVSYAIALAQGEHMDLALKEIRGCLGDVDAAKLRFLTPQSLYRFLLLCKLGQLPLPTPELHDLGRHLLPPELRDKV